MWVLVPSINLKSNFLINDLQIYNKCGQLLEFNFPDVPNSLPRDRFFFFTTGFIVRISFSRKRILDYSFYRTSFLTICKFVSLPQATATRPCSDGGSVEVSAGS